MRTFTGVLLVTILLSGCSGAQGTATQACAYAQEVCRYATAICSIISSDTTAMGQVKTRALLDSLKQSSDNLAWETKRVTRGAK